MIDERHISDTEDEQEDVCYTCRSFSRVKTPYHTKAKGWCMRLSKSVYASDTCGKHCYPRQGKFQMEAKPALWR